MNPSVREGGINRGGDLAPRETKDACVNIGKFMTRHSTICRCNCV